MKNTALLISLALLIMLCGCSMSPRYSFEKRKVSIITQPNGAKVYQINSVYDHQTFIGTTPIMDQPVSILTEVRGSVTPVVMDLMASQIEMLKVRIEKPGYEDYLGNLATDPEKTITHKIPLDRK